MNNMQDLQNLVRRGFSDWQEKGNVKVTEHDGLLLFNYTAKAQFENRWNWFERVSRGLILDGETGEVVARPFDKFWNLGERERRPGENADLLEVTEKMDGSLAVLYRLRGEHRIATRGSFQSEQALWATEFLKRYDLGDLPEDLTLLFEIIYPENRVVVDYGGKKDLVLLGVRDRFTENDVFFEPGVRRVAERFGFSMPQVWAVSTPEEILELAKAIGIESEGWVLRFSDGTWFKVKGERYVEVHRFVTQATFKRVAAAMATGALDQLLEAMPDELLDDIKGWRAEVEDGIAEVKRRTTSAFWAAPMDTRKDFALWVNARHAQDAPYLFAMLDGRDITPMIYKREFGVSSQERLRNEEPA